MVARRAAATPLPLPLHGTAARACGIALAGLMVCARGEHFANVDALPTASWAVFFLAGALLRPLWMLPLLFGIVSLLDLIGLASGSSSDWCLSPAYWALALAYAALWWGGLLFASQLQRQAWRRVTGPLLALLISGSAAYVLSKAGFYFLSGRYPHATLSGFIARVPADYPHALATLAGYIGLAFALLAAHRAAGARPPMGARA
ncbi:hypothetical protein IPT12_08910 [Xanthomonas perforans]|uniref:Uncharacterized protein n=2 Tax=Xanthomonas perforans TaxID=442694 RepID=A0A0G8XCL7_XANPE|nr:MULTISPECIES: hypothetical protein [Xanthomonas]OHX24271.1 hypothetical protein BHL63_03185 [Xanthomonas alfalfae]WVK05356.1 hypothetical protein KWH09_07115 [Xanthomonas campestris pv. olitorii]APP01584.1 hypothetical protein BJD13_22895 [Xanthomonas perforans]AQS77986.1 hypothetical protein XPE_18515 [Xanthomonas perforans 91-118]AYO94761.1 hypothetical protein Xcom_06740 [Xanthomonas axonopodis pv. commiphoreae]